MGIRVSITYQSIRGDRGPGLLAEVGAGGKVVIDHAAGLGDHPLQFPPRSSLLSRFTSMLADQGQEPCIGWLGDQAAGVDDIRQRPGSDR